MSAVTARLRERETALAPKKSDVHPCVAYPDLYPDEGESLNAGRVYSQARVLVYGFMGSCLRAQGLKRFDVALDVFLYATPIQWTKPDIQAYRDVRLCPGGIVPRTFHLDFEGAPDLVMEILSAKTWRKDVGLATLGDKKRYYQEIGVSEYWIYDPEGLRPDKRCIFEGFRLLNGNYAEIVPSGQRKRWFSRVLKAEWELSEARYMERYAYPLPRLIDAVTGQWYPTWEERCGAVAEAEQDRASVMRAEALAAQDREIAILRRRLGLGSATASTAES